MKKIDDYVENIYKNFDETDEETKILIEEIKSHLYEEVEELEKQGLGEDESIERAILSFGQENIVVEEMNTVLKKQNKFSRILLKVSIILYVIGGIFKLINFTSEFLPKNDNSSLDKLTSSYVIDTIQDKIKGKDVLDENVKNEITILLDDFNKENNGLYYIGLEKSGEYSYEYDKNLSEDLIKISGAKGSGLASNNQSDWVIHYKDTGYQNFLNNFIYEQERNKLHSSIPYRLNELSNYLFIISWILVCVSLINKAYIKNVISKRYIAFFVCPSLLILAIFTSGKHTLEESIILLIGIMMLLSKFYSQYYFKKKLEME